MASAGEISVTVVDEMSGQLKKMASETFKVQERRNSQSEDWFDVTGIEDVAAANAQYGWRKFRVTLR
jgi:hypothetical protein